MGLVGLHADFQLPDPRSDLQAKRSHLFLGTTRYDIQLERFTAFAKLHICNFHLETDSPFLCIPTELVVLQKPILKPSTWVIYTATLRAMHWQKVVEMVIIFAVGVLLGGLLMNSLLDANGPHFLGLATFTAGYLWAIKERIETLAEELDALYTRIEHACCASFVILQKVEYLPKKPMPNILSNYCANGEVEDPITRAPLALASPTTIVIGSYALELEHFLKFILSRPLEEGCFIHPCTNAPMTDIEHQECLRYLCLFTGLSEECILSSWNFAESSHRLRNFVACLNSLLCYPTRYDK